MKFFKTVTETRDSAGNLQFKRFAIFETAWLALYVQRYFAGSEDPQLHTHSRSLVSMTLWGRYLESWQYRLEAPEVFNVYHPGILRHLLRTEAHRVVKVFSFSATNLVLAYGKEQPVFSALPPPCPTDG